MKVKELIEKLKEFPEDIEVTIWADHGQHDFICEYLSTVFIHKEELNNHILESTHKDDVEDINDYVTFCQLS